MLSRVAESIYWMARYVERAENVARFMEVSLNVILDQPQEAVHQWEPLVRATGDADYFKQKFGEPNSRNVITFLTFDQDYPSSIISSLSRARENARTIREVISSEAWEQLNEFYHFVKGASLNSQTTNDFLTGFFSAIKHHSHMFNGIVDATMSRNVGWHFTNLGRLLERADKTSRLLDVKYFTLLPSVQDVGTTLDDLQWSAVLRSVSGFEMYRKRYHTITVRRLVEFLILDNEFPRSVRFCIEWADRSLHAISGSPLGSFANLADQRLGRMKAELAYGDVEQIIRGGLHEFVDGLQSRLNAVDEAIHETFFSLRPVTDTPDHDADSFSTATQSQRSNPG
jgi:uncharacterized alpha-E superfamily protein